MTRRFKIAGGTVAIWEDASDDAPFTSPLGSSANLNRVKYHSSLNYTKVLSTQPVTLSLPSRTNFQSESVSHQLFAHGRPGTPFVLGYATVAGSPVSFAGSVPVQLGTLSVATSGSTVGWFGRWLTIGADATYVYAHEFVVAQWQNTSNCETYPALDVPITILVTDELL